MSEGLEYRAVSRSFGRAGRWPALERLDLECPKGKITALVGPNGAGKSTALALAAGLLATTQGEVHLDGRRLTPAEPPRRLGYLPQRSAFPRVLRVGEVLEFTCAARRVEPADRQEVLDTTGLPMVLDREIEGLSSGWLRRLGLALALLPPSDLLLFDEPFVGLDLATLERTVVALQGRARAGSAVVVASHDFEVLDRLVHRVAVLDEGRLLTVQDKDARGCRALYEGAVHRAEVPPAEVSPAVAADPRGER